MDAAEVLFMLVRIALGKEVDFFLPWDIDWRQVVVLSYEQGVAAIAVDGLEKLYESCPDLEVQLDKPEWDGLKYEWFSSCLDSELNYAKHLGVIEKLASLYNGWSIPMLLMKGYGLSLNYPVPSHRPSGDIDVSLFGYGQLGDQMVRNYFKCGVKQNEDKHSVFSIDGISVENHACFVNDTIHPSLKGLNGFFVVEAEKSVAHQIGKLGILLPSVMFNALFLPFHCADHFVHGEASIRQLCDWACFVQRHGPEVDWDVVRELAEIYGFLKFYRCLNGIVEDCLGVPVECLPDWPRNKKLEQKVMDEILTHPKSCTTLASKVLRFFTSRWKYRMVYNDSMLLTSFRLAKSYHRWQDKDAVSIWEK